MPLSRREFLKMGGVALGAALVPPVMVENKPKAESVGNTASMLYDATLCVGCRACQVACKKRSKLRPETDVNQLYEAPLTLSAYTWTLINLYKGTEGTSFVKQQCMHCVEPACVSVCPVGALEKLPTGPVVYHADRCIGCRYCMAACPFGIPKAQWDQALPLIQKCDFCADRLANGQQPACGEACPTKALIYGKRDQMLDTAHQRITDNSAYIQKVYGEAEVGGTAMLYITGLEFAKLGFPKLGTASLPSITWPYMQLVPGIVVAVAGLSTALYLFNHRNDKGKEA